MRDLLSKEIRDEILKDMRECLVEKFKILPGLAAAILQDIRVVAHYDGTSQKFVIRLDTSRMYYVRSDAEAIIDTVYNLYGDSHTELTITAHMLAAECIDILKENVYHIPTNNLVNYFMENK